MKFALIENKKTEAIKGARGICPSCGSEMIAHCGEKKVHHWKHKGKRKCDKWWENETEWHRSWKNKFPIEWQEITIKDNKNNEKHIADIRTSHGLVIEFQHSRIEPDERIARENFYQNMVWVVDGTRLKRDYPRFVHAEKHNTNKPNIYGVKLDDECFPSEWLRRKVPVIFDFLGTQLSNEENDLRNKLYCLFPKQLGIVRIYAEFSRKAFIQSVIKGEWTMRSKIFMDRINLADQEIRNREAKRDDELKRIISELAKKQRKRYRSPKRNRRL